MSRRTFELLRLPAALLLLLIAGFILVPRDDGDPAVADASPSIVVGQPFGAIVTPSPEPVPSPSATPIVTLSPEPSPTAEPTPTVEPTEEATPQPVANNSGAEVLACRSISGSTCNRQLGTLPANAGAFTALVRFTDANAGDTYNVILSGPSGTIPGAAYTLQGSGDGYYYTTFQAGGLPGGEYTLTATRNGDAVAVTTFRNAGG